MGRQMINNIPVPERMKYLGVDHRGYPKFYIAHRDDSGKCHFVVNDAARTFKCAVDDLCSLCGTKLRRGRWFVGGPLSAFISRSYFDPPMHFECMSYAMQVCPWLAIANYSRKRGLEKIAADVGRAVVDHTILPDRPAVYVCVHARGHDRELSGDAHTAFRFSPHAPFIGTQYWQNGKRIDNREGAAIALSAVESYLKERQ